MSQFLRVLASLQIFLILGTFLLFSYAWYRLHLDAAANKAKVELLIERQKLLMDAHKEAQDILRQKLQE